MIGFSYRKTNKKFHDMNKILIIWTRHKFDINSGFKPVALVVVVQVLVDILRSKFADTPFLQGPEFLYVDNIPQIPDRKTTSLLIKICLYMNVSIITLLV